MPAVPSIVTKKPLSTFKFRILTRIRDEVGHCNDRKARIMIDGITSCSSLVFWRFLLDFEPLSPRFIMRLLLNESLREERWWKFLNNLEY